MSLTIKTSRIIGVKLTQQTAMIPPEDANNIQTEIRRIIPHEGTFPSVQLCLDIRQFLQYLYAYVDQSVNIEGELHKVEKKSDVLLHGQIIRTGDEGTEHIDDLRGALPRDHMLVEVTQILELLGDCFEVEFATGVLFHLSTLRHIDAELFSEELAYLVKRKITD